ncbi:hypothetical protein Q8W40_18590 [Vibrio penaeicida]|uniref:hypothetical protein n=1 Tax=Vibrio penaeicida TaxID=104609 RepID=UPI002732408A|nr:hypothetical protein [Vibrio penaeicida]MDP2574205.1 hypothetical protein [Vibrio penaeicida]
MNAQWQGSQSRKDTQPRKDIQRLKEISQLNDKIVDTTTLFKNTLAAITPNNDDTLALPLLKAMQHRLKLADLHIAVMNTTDEALASACAYLELAGEHQKYDEEKYEAKENNQPIKKFEDYTFPDEFASELLKKLKKYKTEPKEHETEREIQKTELKWVGSPYLLLLGENQTLDETFDYEKLNKIVYSGIEHIATLSAEKQAELTKLGFHITPYSENGVYQLIVELSQPKKTLWLYFLEWWLDQVVVLGKPITYYNNTFFMPLDKPTSAEGEAKFPIVTPQYHYELKEHFHPQEFRDLPKDASQKEKDRQKIEKERQDQYIAEQEAWMYFLPHQRSYLFNEKVEDSSKGRGTDKNKIKPIQEYRLIGEHKKDLLNAARTETLLWELKVRDNLTVKMPIKQVYLYRYFNGLMYLAIHVEHQFKCETSWVEGLLSGSHTLRENLATYQYENCLKFTKNARVLYPAFVDAEKEGKHFAKALTQNGKTLAEDKQEDLTFIVGSQKRFQASEMLSRPVRHLLCEFLSSSGHLNEKNKEGEIERTHCANILDSYIKTLPDDRMFTSAVYSYAGNFPQSEEQIQRFHSYAHYVDDSSMTWGCFSEFAYNPEFVKTHLKANSYTRWNGAGLLMSFNDYNHTYIGQQGFFSTNIAPIHVPYIYNRMLLSTLFYRLSFEHYNREITLQTNALINKKLLERFLKHPLKVPFGFIKRLIKLAWFFIRRDSDGVYKHIKKRPFSSLKEEFIQFVNQYWFVELTQQIQGKEMFQLMLKPLESERQFEQIKSELDAANDYADGKRNRILAVVAILISFASIGWLFEAIGKWVEAIF